MFHHQEMGRLLLESGAMWASGLHIPCFLAGAGLGVPAAIGTVSTGDSKLLSLATAIGGVLGGVAADRLSTTFFENFAGGELTCYDILTKGVGPACLLLVVLNRGVRAEPSVAVQPAAAVALASLILEPLFSAYLLRTTSNSAAASSTRIGAAGVLLKRALGRAGGGGRRKSAAVAAAEMAAEAAIARARWLTAGAQVALWAAVVLAYANISLRLSRLGRLPGRTVAGYMTALRALAAEKRGTGGWVRIDQWGKGGTGWSSERGTQPNSPVPGRVGDGWEGRGRGGGGGYDNGGSGDGGALPRAHRLIGSLYEMLVPGGGWVGSGGGRIDSDATAVGHDQVPNNGPPFERGEVTVRGIHCSGLDAAITGRPPSSSPSNAGRGGNGTAGGADGGGGIIAGGASRPFYVTITLEGVNAKTSARPGFSPCFTEVFPLGCDCPVRGAFMTIAVVDSFEAGRSGRGDRILGEVHLPLDAAQLVPGTSMSHGDASFSPSSGGGGGHDTGGGGRAEYRLSGDWELQGALGGSLGGARVGADIVVRGPPSPSSAAGRLRKRESVGWYAR